VIPIPTIANTSPWTKMLLSGTAAKVIAMISADRMKSVFMALATF
jgi:hypothetical protein